MDLQTPSFHRRTELRPATAAVSLAPGLFETLWAFADRSLRRCGIFNSAVATQEVASPGENDAEASVRHFTISPKNAVVMAKGKHRGQTVRIYCLLGFHSLVDLNRQR